MRTNTTKAKLEEGNVVFGAIINRYAPDLIELFGAPHYDFVMIDCEHGPPDTILKDTGAWAEAGPKTTA